MKKALAIIAAALLAVMATAQPYGVKYVSPDVQGNSVTFRLKADNATSVRVYGDFLPGIDAYNLGGNEAMTRQENGLWEYTATNLAPEFYFYYFEVDGVRMLDPATVIVARNYVDYYNTFMIKGAESENYEFASSGRGSLQTVWYNSPEYGGQRRMNVYLPYEYDASAKKKYPVLYMLPGGGDDEDTWVEMGRLCEIMDNLIAKGQAVPMVVVMTNSMPNLLAGQKHMLPIPGSKSHFMMKGEELLTGGNSVPDFVNNIVPFVESHFNVKTDKAHRAIAGVSMGSMYTFTIVDRNPGMFDYVGFIGAAGRSNDMETSLKNIKKDGHKLIWFGVGNKDMGLGGAKAMMKQMDEVGLKYEYFDSQDGHNWRSWRRDLQELAPKLFK